MILNDFWPWIPFLWCQRHSFLRWLQDRALERPLLCEATLEAKIIYSMVLGWLLMAQLRFKPLISTGASTLLSFLISMPLDVRSHIVWLAPLLTTSPCENWIRTFITKKKTCCLSWIPSLGKNSVWVHQGSTGRCGVNSIVYRNDQLKGSHELLPAYILLDSILVPSQAKRSAVDLVISITIANNYWALIYPALF